MEHREQIFVDIIKQECPEDAYEDSLNDVENNEFEIKEEKEDIKTETCADDEDADEETCFKNFMNTDITLEDDIKQETQNVSA